MATVVLGAVGQAIGGPVGGAIGSTIGGLIDQFVLAPLISPTIKQEGARLTDLHVQVSSEGAPIARVWGKMRVSPQVIWATKFRERKSTKKSGGKGAPKPKTKTVEYSYSISFAVGLCEGPITGIGKVWADGKLLRRSDYTTRLYLGTETQSPDPKILAIEGADRAPAFRGLAYLVFEDLALESFGNRVPQITAEVWRRPASDTPQLEDLLQAVTLIPGATEFGYATTPVSVKGGINETVADNAHASGDATDLVVALDQLEEQAPEVNHVSLVVAWHGTDLRCGNCEIRPMVEDGSRETKPFNWRVGPLNRNNAVVVSHVDGAPAFGGAPSDRSVYEAIREMKHRGLDVTLYPFILMDIPADNELPDPYGATRGGR